MSRLARGKGKGSGKGSESSSLGGNGGVGEEGGFPIFWRDYPRKVGKQEAKKAWDAAPPDADTQAKIHEALQWQRNQPDWLKQNRQFVPYPATYLRNRRWEDEPPEPTVISDALADSLPGLQRFAERHLRGVG